MNEQARPNSLAARDIAYCVHPQTNLARHRDVGPLTITHGEGIHVVSDDGRRFIDTNSGLWCSSLGYANERLARAAYEQMRTLGAYHTFRHSTNEAVVLLSEKLVAMAPKPMAKVLLQCSGSEANDTAIKLAWYYHAAKGNPGKYKIIGRERGYHGTSCATTSLSGKRDMHADFHLPLPGFLHAQFPHYYREHEEGETEEEFATRMAEALEALILAEGPDTVAAFFAEPVMGAGGAVVPPRTYFAKVQDVLRRHDILFVADEVICGFGRTGNMWGTETFALEPDMMSCAKALSAGMIPISALMISDRVYDALVSQSEKLGAFAHGYTYSGHPVSAAVALETLKIYEEMDVVAQTRRLGAHLLAGLRTLLDYPFVGDVNGVGLIAGIELVKDRERRTPLDPALKIPQALDANAREQGLIMRIVGERVAFAPPFIITEDEIDEILRRFRLALEKTFAQA
jgi:4-aminobutyrate--pyruvate transaminase